MRTPSSSPTSITRFQAVSIHGETSKRFAAKYGVPDGSCLGPTLFSLSKLYTIIERHHAYADDTQLYISFNANSSEEQSAALENMQNERLDAIWQA